MIGKIYKNGVLVGSCKHLTASINSIKETCKFFKFNIEEYEIKDLNGNSLWKGTETFSEKT